jgi:uncharacterized FlaG/YvyC family protein
MSQNHTKSLSTIDLSEDWLIKRVLSSNYLTVSDLCRAAQVSKIWQAVASNGIEAKWTEEMNKFYKSSELAIVVGPDYQSSLSGRLGYIEAVKVLVQSKINSKARQKEELLEALNSMQNALNADLMDQGQQVNNLLSQFAEDPTVDIDSDFGMEIIEEALTFPFEHGKGWKSRLTREKRMQISSAYMQARHKKDDVNRMITQLEELTGSIAGSLKLLLDKREQLNYASRNRHM